MPDWPGPRHDGCPRPVSSCRAPPSPAAPCCWRAAAQPAAKLAFTRAGTTVNPLHPERAASLVTSGLHRLSRNPMYLGHALLLAGMALMLGNELAFVAAAAYIAWVDRFQVGPEERALRARFGASYDDYCRRVRRWI